MSIQVRRGNEIDLDPDKLDPGEWAVTLDRKRIYICVGNGDVRRISTYEEMVRNIHDATEDVAALFTADVQAAILEAMQSATDADLAAQEAVEKGNYAQSCGDYAKSQGDYAAEKGNYAATIPDQIDNVKAFVGYDADYDVYGVEVDMTAHTFTRLGNAVDKTAGADFDNARPFARRRCNLADDGTVNAYYGDPGYKEDGSNGQVMVEQPSFYYKMEPLILEGEKVRKARYFVTGAPREGYKLHPAFIQDGKPKEKIYMSAFEGSLFTADMDGGHYVLDDAQTMDIAMDKLSSIAGAKPMSGLTQQLTRSNARNLAHNRGTGWEQSYAATVSASQLLMLIEYATFDMQSAIGDGNVSKTDDGSTNMSEYTGATVSLGNTSGAILNDNGVQVISYRGEENFWGNILTWIDGLNSKFDATVETDIIYIADHGFADDTENAPYQETGITPSMQSGYISAFCYAEEYDWLFIAGEVLGNSTLPVGDRFYQTSSSGWRVARLGGGWYYGSDSGAYCLTLNDAAYGHHRAIGTRLTYIPQTENMDYRKSLQKQIGDISALQTTAKNDLVSAINEAATTGSGGGGGSAAVVTFLSSGWTAGDSGYTQTMAVPGMTDAAEPQLQLPKNATSAQAAVWDSIKKSVPAAGNLTLTVDSQPGTDLDVIVLSLPAQDGTAVGDIAALSQRITAAQADADALRTDVDEINANLMWQYDGQGKFEYRMYNGQKEVIIHNAQTLNSVTANTQYLIGTLPAAYWPQAEINRAVIYLNNSNALSWGVIYISENGDIKFKPTVSGGCYGITTTYAVYA